MTDQIAAVVTVTDTIAAIATATGGGLGIVRLSGPGAVSLAEKASRKSAPPPGQLRRAQIFDPEPESGEPLDDGLLVVFRAPKSFTGEDVAEFHGHGGPQVLSSVLGAFLEAGARLARPGEFSERAFLNGKLDLTQAEGIADLIAARSDDARRAALRQLEGGLKTAAEAIVGELKFALALTEATIDFPEDVGELDVPGVTARLDAAISQTEALLASARRGRALTEGITVAIIGRPNAGKSSLLNALAGAERAIVTAIPGTTRDVLSEQITLGGLPVRALDTAGLRETTDEVEKIGVERARAAALAADVVLVIADATVGVTDEERELLEKHAPRALLVVNKTDLSPCDSPGALHVSAKTGAGLEALGERVAELLTGDADRTQIPLVTRARHEDALRRTLASLLAAHETLNLSLPPELLAVDLHGALQTLGELTGQTSRAEIIEGIFRQFCIGK